MAVSHSSRLEHCACVPPHYGSTGAKSVAPPPQNMSPPSREGVGICDESPKFLRPSDHALHSSPKKTRSLSHLRDPDHVKRPENAFMLFRKSRIGFYHNAGAPQRQASISKLISSEWNKFPREAKAPWYDLAKYVAAEHRRHYPDYQYRPKCRKNLKEPSHREQKGTPLPLLPASPANATTSHTILAPPLISLPTPPPIPTIDQSIHQKCSFEAVHHNTDTKTTSRRGHFLPCVSATASRNMATATTMTTTTTTSKTTTATIPIRASAATAFDRETWSGGSATMLPSFDIAKADPADNAAAPSDKTLTLPTGEGSHNVIYHMSSVSTVWDLPDALLPEYFECGVHAPSEPLAPPPHCPLDIAALSSNWQFDALDYCPMVPELGVYFDTVPHGSWLKQELVYHPVPLEIRHEVATGLEVELLDAPTLTNCPCAPYLCFSPFPQGGFEPESL